MKSPTNLGTVDSNPSTSAPQAYNSDSEIKRRMKGVTVTIIKISRVEVADDVLECTCDTPKPLGTSFDCGRAFPDRGKGPWKEFCCYGR